MYNIAVIPGDGIGKEVMEATINVLKSLIQTRKKNLKRKLKSRYQMMKKI